MTFDPFASHSRAAVDPASAAFAVTPHDTNELGTLPRALYIGTGGALVLRCADSGADVTFKNLAAGQILPVRARYVRAAGTTAADIIALT